MYSVFLTTSKSSSLKCYDMQRQLKGQQQKQQQQIARNFLSLVEAPFVCMLVIIVCRRIVFACIAGSLAFFFLPIER